MRIAGLTPEGGEKLVGITFEELEAAGVTWGDVEAAGITWGDMEDGSAREKLAKLKARSLGKEDA